MPRNPSNPKPKALYRVQPVMRRRLASKALRKRLVAEHVDEGAVDRVLADFAVAALALERERLFPRPEGGR